MTYKKWNLYLGWLVFLIATAVYFITIEDTVSLWDCGEYITAAYKLEVGHPPGAPLFMVLGRLFSFFADPEHVAVWINRLSAVSSSMTILFMFWSITMLVKKLVMRDKKEMTSADQIAIFGSATIGALAYTFSESFWFSAVEGEVYAMASLFTAVIFWAILKWDEEMALVQDGTLSLDAAPNRWLLLIMFLLGLAIGVHLLGILVVPAICFVIYFRYKKIADLKGIILTGLLSVFILGFIQEGVIPGSISLASSFEVAFVNSLGLPFFSGTIFFFGLLVIACVWLIRYARRNSNSIVYNATMGLILLLIGYGSFAVIVIRSNANTPLDENDPENLVTLHAYLKREQYGSAPLLFGPHWNSKENEASMYDSRSPFYLRRFVVTKGEKVLKAFKNEEAAKKYASENGGSYEEKYFESNAQDRLNSVKTYAQTTFFPRMYWDMEPQRIEGYIKWSGYDPNDETVTDIGRDGKRLPSFGENMNYFIRYQVNWMYWRYFMWNFAGRQNDIQGHGDNMRGNWISGFGFIDNARLGNQDEAAPYYTSQNPSNNKFFLLPLILGIVGLFFHFYRAPKDAFVVLLAFLFTGVAIVVYLNQKPIEPRERDYAFAGSFYFFALWIGVGVYALYEAFTRFTKKDIMKTLMYAGGGMLFFMILDSGSEVSMPNTLTWLVLAGGTVGLFALMMGVKKFLKTDSQGAVLATIIGLFVPVIMGIQGWDDHDRSLKTTADDLALNYLESCSKNSVIFTNGDNDTFPLWYMQEVEGKRTDVRVCNLSLMQTDWYTDQMKMRAYDSDPLPIKFREDQILMYAGNTDAVYFLPLDYLVKQVINRKITCDEKVIKEIVSMRVKHNSKVMAQKLSDFRGLEEGLRMSAPMAVKNVLEANKITKPAPTSLAVNAQTVYDEVVSVGSILAVVETYFQEYMAQQKNVPEDEYAWYKQYSDAYSAFMQGFEEMDLGDVMAFVRDDKNIVMDEENKRPIRFFPSSKMSLKVNKENAVKSGVITAAQKENCLDAMQFEFTKGGLSREQVMMLDVMANNDWKRGIYFSSPGGSDVSIALYQKGYIKQNGMAFELNPLNDLTTRFNGEKMYANLMQLYKFGAMNNPDVLTDYYARRHTAQYRLHFASLADEYLMRADREEQMREMNKRNIEILRKGGQMDQVARLEKQLVGVDERVKDYKKKALALLKRSLEVMPADVVIDYGEPTSSGREKYSNGGVQLDAYSDGILHDYVGMLYRAGDRKAAEELGSIVAGQLESILNYFAESDAYFAGNLENQGDLLAALDSYFKLHMASIDPISGNKNGELARRTQAKINELYKTTFPSIYDALEQKANENGESTRRGSKAGRYARMLFTLQDYIEAIGVHYGYLQGQPSVQQNPSQMDIERMMQQMPVQDSVIQ